MAREGFFGFCGLNLEQTLLFCFVCGGFFFLFVCFGWGVEEGLVGWLVFGLFVLFVRAKQ